MVLCLNDSDCDSGGRCLSGICVCINDNFRNNALVQPIIGAILHDIPSLRCIYLSTFIILTSTGLISNIFSLITFMRDRIRFTVGGVYLNILAGCGMILMVLVLTNILISFRYDDHLSRLWACHGYPYMFPVIVNIGILMSTAVAIENILSRYVGFDRFRSRKCALLTSFILICLPVIFNLEKIFARHLIDDQSGHFYCIYKIHASPFWSHMNHFSSYLCLIIPCSIHLICTLFILLKIQRQPKQTYYRKIFGHKDLLLPSIIILFCLCSYVIFRYTLNTCITYSSRFYIRLHIGFILILLIPQIFTFAIYVLPNIYYLKEFQQSWIARLLCCFYTRQVHIQELQVIHKLWQQRSSLESVMTISSMNDSFVDTESYNKLKLEV